MTLKELVSKYISRVELVFVEIKVTQNMTCINIHKIEDIINHAKLYLEDAKYYERRNKLETSLTSVSYCEGILDALLLLGIVEFSW